jgi:hypothetical protein
MIVTPFLWLHLKDYCKFPSAQKNVFSAKGAGLNASLGQRPREKSICKNKRCKCGSIAALASTAHSRIEHRACD